MSATGALASAPAEIPEQAGEQVSDVPVAAEAATAVEVEQAEVGEAMERSAEETTALAPALSEPEREEAAARVREMEGLPLGLRECLARVVAASADAVDGTVRVPIDAAIRAVSEALPEFLRQHPAGKARAEHPAGEAFFRGDPTELSDADAEEIARGQLARSGLLRGQRVRAAD